MPENNEKTNLDLIIPEYGTESSNFKGKNPESAQSSPPPSSAISSEDLSEFNETKDQNLNKVIPQIPNSLNQNLILDDQSDSDDEVDVDSSGCDVHSDEDGRQRPNEEGITY